MGKKGKALAKERREKRLQEISELRKVAYALSERSSSIIMLYYGVNSCAFNLFDEMPLRLDICYFADGGRRRLWQL